MREEMCVAEWEKDMNGLTRTATLTFSQPDCSLPRLLLLPLILLLTVMLFLPVLGRRLQADDGMSGRAADS